MTPVYSDSRVIVYALGKIVLQKNSTSLLLITNSNTIAFKSKNRGQIFYVVSCGNSIVLLVLAT